MSGGARETALQVLIAVRSKSAWADAALKARLSRDGLAGPDAALATRLVYGVLQNQLLLDFWISAYCSQKPEHLQLPLQDILRLGVYQIVFLDRIPDSAAVNESVNLAKAAGRGSAAGLVNAVLRRVARSKDALPKVPETDRISWLSVTYSHPKWLVQRLTDLIGSREAEAFLQADNTPVPISVQVNSLKTDAEQLCQNLSGEGVRVQEHPWVPGCLELTETGDLASLRAFQRGEFFVQDAAAALVTTAAQPRPGMRVIDVCAAPGGKSFSAAIAMGDRGELLACDIYPMKLRRIREGAARLGLNCIRTAEADGKVFRQDWAGTADLVLVDAPCSGIGIIRKKPDIRYKDPGEFSALPALQAAIIANAALYVRPGGALVYSTCTVLPEENEEIVRAFLQAHPDFSAEPFSLPAPAGRTDGRITLWPQSSGTDGFFICRMRRA